MGLKLTLTRLPNLNDTIVIKQSGGHYFIAAPDSIVIDKEGLIRLIVELGKVGYITPLDLVKIVNIIYPVPEWLEEEEDIEKGQE